jgi:hypothetical protein
VADDGDRLPRLDGEGNVFQNPLDAVDGGQGGGRERRHPAEEFQYSRSGGPRYICGDRRYMA